MHLINNESTGGINKTFLNVVSLFFHRVKRAQTISEDNNRLEEKNIAFFMRVLKIIFKITSLVHPIEYKNYFLTHLRQIAAFV